MRYLTVTAIVTLTLLFTPLFSQESFSYREEGWREGLEKLEKEIGELKKSRKTKEIEEAVNLYLVDKPVQILAEESVWNVVGSYLTDPYSNTIEYLFRTLYRHPNSKKGEIVVQLEKAMAEAVRELTPENQASPRVVKSPQYQQKAAHLRKLLNSYQIQKSALFLAKLNIYEALSNREYDKVFQLIEEGDRLSLFNKEERYIADLYRVIIERALDNLPLMEKIHNKVLDNIKSTERVGLTPLNNYDILLTTGKALGYHDQLNHYQSSYDYYNQMIQDSYGDFISMLENMAASRKDETVLAASKSSLKNDILATQMKARAATADAASTRASKSKKKSSSKLGKVDPANSYLVIASALVKSDPEWNRVATTLAHRYGADILYFEEHPKELLVELKRVKPRYLAIVEQPEELEVGYVVELNRLLRNIEEGYFNDCLWGIITGYNAHYAMQMVENSGEPFVIETALNTTGESSSGNIYKSFAWLDDGRQYFWGYKENVNDEVTRKEIEAHDFLKIFVEQYEKLQPDLIISSSHATEWNLEMPFSTGDIRPLDGQLYADFCTPYFLPEHRNPRVYFAAGNCLIGNMQRDGQAMASAWLSGGGATSMIGYTVPTWYGRAGWGTLKYWIANPGNLTLAQANFLNQQEMLYILEQWDPQLLQLNPVITSDLNTSGFKATAERELGYELDKERLGFYHDRDVLCFYGDPAWDVRVTDWLNTPAYTTKFNKASKRSGGNYEIVVKTDKSYKPERVKGAGIKEIHVEDLPFAYFLPERVEGISGITLVERGGGSSRAAGRSSASVSSRGSESGSSRGSDREISLDDYRVVINRDFILIYNAPFEADREYVITLEVK